LEQAGIRLNQLRLRQKEGFLAAMPLGSLEFDPRHTPPLPASSAANLFPLAYSGKTDPAGFYIGKDRFGTNILVDFDRRAADKTNANILILGNSGQGKSYLMKLLLINLRASGKTIIALDAEAEYRDLCTAMGGCYVDYASGEYIINPLEPKLWDDGAGKGAQLSQHIAYLKDFFRSYKGFSDAHIDVIELFLGKLYAGIGIEDSTDFSQLTAEDYPIMEDFYGLVEQAYQDFDPQERHLYTQEILQEICLGLHSMCLGAESKFFNGHTNITDSRFLVFGVKELLHTNARLCGAVMFNLFSYLTGALLGKGNTVASLDELYLFLNNLTSIEYIRNAMKRVRKKDSAIVIATQNVDDFLMEGIREYTKPLFSIPAHQFLFNAGHAEPKAYTETLQMEPSEFERIRHAERGLCIYRAGGERFLLEVKAPDHKSVLFGKAGGK
jgi:type IV secretory pathway VirB4 component